MGPRRFDARLDVPLSWILVDPVKYPDRKPGILQKSANGVDMPRRGYAGIGHDERTLTEGRRDLPGPGKDTLAVKQADGQIVQFSRHEGGAGWPGGEGP